MHKRVNELMSLVDLFELIRIEALRSKRKLYFINLAFVIPSIAAIYGIYLILFNFNIGYVSQFFSLSFLFFILKQIYDKILEKRMKFKNIFKEDEKEMLKWFTLIFEMKSVLNNKQDSTISILEEEFMNSRLKLIKSKI